MGDDDRFRLIQAEYERLAAEQPGAPHEELWRQAEAAVPSGDRPIKEDWINARAQQLTTTTGVPWREAFRQAEAEFRDRVQEEFQRLTTEQPETSHTERWEQAEQDATARDLDKNPVPITTPRRKERSPLQVAAFRIAVVLFALLFALFTFAMSLGNN